MALELQGEYTTYQDFDENRERWIPRLKERGLTPVDLGPDAIRQSQFGAFSHACCRGRRNRRLFLTSADRRHNPVLSAGCRERALGWVTTQSLWPDISSL